MLGPIYPGSPDCNVRMFRLSHYSHLVWDSSPRRPRASRSGARSSGVLLAVHGVCKLIQIGETGPIHSDLSRSLEETASK